MTGLPTAMANLAHFAALGRPLHLIGGWTFFGLGAAIAGASGVPLDVPLALGGMLAVSAIQLMTHYSNDYFDLDADLANTTPTRWSGGSRVLAEGRLPRRLALTATGLLALVAVFMTIWLTFMSRAPLQTMLLLLLAMALAWGYSAPPIQLNRRALGEITGALLVPGLTTLVSYQLQAATLALLPLLAVVPLCCFQFAMLLVVNFPDAAGDATVGKQTLVVRLGGPAAARLYSTVILAPYLLLPLLIASGLPALVAVLLLVMAPLAVWLAWIVWRGGWNNPARWNALGFWSIGLLTGSAALELLGFVLITRGV